MPHHRLIIRKQQIVVILLFGSLNLPLAFGQSDLQFNRDIRPILSAHCYQCHGPDEQHREADLRLDVEQGVRDAFGVTDLEDNTAWQRLISQDPDEQMPPPTVHSKITQNEIDQLRRWITQGAAFQQHWSFRPPVVNALPAVKKKDWVRNPIDSFVLARLESRQWKPNPPATRQQLIRRLTLDLTGLPPTLSEVDAFLRDDEPAAYERLVDRLLESPRLFRRLVCLSQATIADSSVC